jgi:hypothetical protein
MINMPKTGSAMHIADKYPESVPRIHSAYIDRPRKSDA